MIMDKMDKRIFDGVLGLSCLENYLLGILKIHGIDISRLYSRSLVHAKKLYDDVFIKNRTYESYREIPSMHNAAKELGIIKFTFVETDPGFDLALRLKKLGEDEYILVRVKPVYIKEKYRIKLWRDDHYMLVFLKSDEIHFINDTPRAEGILIQEELPDFYDNGYMWIKVLGPMTKKMIDYSMVNFIETFQFSKQFNSFEIIPYSDIDKEEKIKNMLFIYRISLQRTIEFSSIYFNLSSFEQYITDFNRILAKLEYDIFKKNISIRGSTDILLLIFKINLALYEEIYKKLEGEE